MTALMDGRKHCTECGAGFESLVRIPAKVSDLSDRDVRGPYLGDRGLPPFLKQGKFTLMWCKKCLFSWGAIPDYTDEDKNERSQIEGVQSRNEADLPTDG